MTNFFAASHALIKNENKFLITRRSSKNTYLPLTWDIPGGTVEKGETMEQALHREISEETNLEVKIIQPIHVYTNLSQLPDRQTFQVVFTCEFIKGEIRLNPDEHDQYKWITKNEFIKYDLIPFVASLVESQEFDYLLT